MPSITRRPATIAVRGEGAAARIKAAVAALLAEGVPFTEIGISRIAARAGVARSTFYVYFRDKSELLLGLTEDLGDPIVDLISEWEPGRANSRAELADLTVTVLRYYRQNAHILGAVAELAAYDAPVRAFWNGLLEALIARGCSWLAAEQVAGRTSAEVKVDVVSRIFVVGGMQAIAHQVATGAASDDEGVAREIADAQWFGAFRRHAEKR